LNKNRIEERIKLRRGKAGSIKTLASKDMLNLHTISDALDQVMTELSGKAAKEPEIAAAVEVLLAAKRLLKAYSQRMLNEPFKADTSFDNYPIVYPEGSVKPLDMIAEMRNNLVNLFHSVTVWIGRDYIADPKADKLFDELTQSYSDFYDVVNRIEGYFKDASKGNYDQFEAAGEGFDGPQDIMQRRKDKRDADEKKRLDRQIERQTEQQFKQRTGESICHDENGQFVDCESASAVASVRSYLNERYAKRAKGQYDT
jgi:hypothetical protein